LNPNDIFALCSRGLIVAYSGEPEVAVELLRDAFRYDPIMPEIFRENLAEAFYLMRDYESALREYERWQNPSFHTFTHIAACYAQLGRQEDAAAAAQAFEKNSPADADFASYAKAHARLCKRAEDAEHWLEGYRKAGLMV
jgi:tetratricopeptide (TPR) repeat protein